MAYARGGADIGQALPTLDAQPRTLWDGLIPNASLGVGRQAHIFNPSIVPGHYPAHLNQSGAIEWDTFYGRPQAGGLQNMYLVVARSAIQPATLDPQYGIQSDSYANVYRNIVSTGSLFQN